MSRPCSSQVYQVTPTPARVATSSRRSPGVRRRGRGRQADLLRGDPLPPAAQESGQLLAAQLSRGEAAVAAPVSAGPGVRVEGLRAHGY